MAVPPRIITVGDVITDVLAVLSGPLATGSDAPAAIRFTGGGQAANTAAWLGWLRSPVTLVGAVGADDAGRARLAELADLGVHCAVRQCPDTPTGTVIVLAHDGERTMITERGANLRLTAADVDAALAEAPDARHLHLSAYTLLDAGSRDAGLRALAAARELGLTTSVDAASAAPLRQVGAVAFLDWVRDVDLLLANSDEATALAGEQEPEAQARALATTVRNAVVKRGADGAVWACQGGPVIGSPAQRVPVVDVTGAGDAFAAGLLAAWVAGAAPATALTRAGETGAVAVSTVGARPAVGATGQGD
ncbi:sugar kinase [Micromonospora polyrhachis]|uniref:Sugar/nucleoside kinase (Ribokinase family) n=1 Tax=Micromonospora polyrhachis TaxID=1282883 RepID=A0A7W7WMM0_9ACTN|nr:PfkB family carbohydrate kinase [Micromonospora polyrhachis]MBB4957301.1 sugar/nucleoside kinase (ribokinase family) [Micromonospora polyrhachis]